jgi:hypothetical protein
MRWYYAMLIAACAAATFGCSEEDVDSSAIRTQGIYARFELVGDGDDTEVTADIRVGGRTGTVIDLAGEDELVVTSGDERRTMSGSNGDYSVTMSGSDDGQEFVIAFERGSDDEGAPDSTATLPDGFTIGGISSGEEVSRGDGVTVTWDPNGTDDDMSWSLDGDCLFREDGEMGDSGELDLTASNYDLHPDDEETTCEATLTIERSRPGHLDPAYGEGGGVLAIQRRSISFMSAP